MPSIDGRWAGSIKSSTPIRSSASTAGGMRHSPQALSGGEGRRSITIALRPCIRAAIATASPAGPPPATSTSQSRAEVIFTKMPTRTIRFAKAGSGPRDLRRPCDRMRIDLYGLDASLRNRGAFHCTSDAPMCNPRPSHCIQLARFGKSSHNFVGLTRVSRLQQSTETEDRQMSTANWIVDGILVPDIILPSQHFDSRTRCLEPEKRLMLAVLSDAVRCFRMGAGSERGPRRRLFSDAEWWLFRAKGNEPFSVEYICEALEIDPGRLRRGVHHWRDPELAGEAPRMIRRSPVLTARLASARAFRSRREG